MSSTLLLTSHSLRVNNNCTGKVNNDVDYKFIFEDTTKNPCSVEYTQNWTHLFPKEYPYTSLKEGQTFQLNDGLHNGETFKVHVVKDSYRMGHGKSYHVWFRKN